MIADVEVDVKHIVKNVSDSQDVRCTGSGDKGIKIGWFYGGTAKQGITGPFEEGITRK